MKQRIIHYLDSITEELFFLSTALFHHESGLMQKIQRLLQQENFSVALHPSLLKGEIKSREGPILGFFTPQPASPLNREEGWKLSIAHTISIGAVLGISSIIKEAGGGIQIYCYPWDGESMLFEENILDQIHGGFLLKTGEKTCESGGNIAGFINNATLNRLFCHNLKEVGIIEIHGSKENSIPSQSGKLSYLFPTISPMIGIQDSHPERVIHQLQSGQPSPFTKDAILKGSQAAAFTALDILSNRDLYREMREEFKQSDRKS